MFSSGVYICLKCLNSNRVIDEHHVHNNCVRKSLEDKLDEYVDNYESWKPQLLEAQRQYGKGLMVFDQHDGKTELVYYYSDEITESLGEGVWICAKTWDHIFSKDVMRRRKIEQ